MAVYFIKTVGADYVKIGWTDGDIYRRMDSLQTGCPLDLEVYFITPDAERSEEARLHKKFAEYRTNGEWFSLSRELSDYIERQRRIAVRRRTVAEQFARDKEEEEYWERIEQQLTQEYEAKREALRRVHKEVRDARESSGR